jgi:hypothetical protein
MKWICYARPAATGTTCYHENTIGITSVFSGKKLLCCEMCGCTKKASDDRFLNNDIDKKKRKI